MNIVRIQLKNNVKCDAVPLPGDMFQATLPSGRVKTYALSELKKVFLANEDDPMETTEIITNKEDKMIHNIQHYLFKANFATEEDENKTMPVFVRVVTNDIPDSLVEDYGKSIATKNVVNDRVFAIQSGNWLHHLFIERLVKKNIKFKMRIISNKELVKVHHTVLDSLIKGATFAYANADYSFFLTIEGEKKYGLRAMGLTITHAKKSAKRLQEIVRQVEMALYIEDGEFDIEFKDFGMKGDFIKFFDGKSYIRRSFALQMADSIPDENRRTMVKFLISTGALCHVTIRILTPKGLIKGDAVIVKDGYIKHDVVTHPENLKSELKTTGWSFACIWEHAMVHNAVWDVQSETNFRHALTVQHHHGDILRVVKSVQDSLAEGKLPSWLLLDETAHNDDGVVVGDRLSNDYNRSWVRWQAHNLPVEAGQNMTYMAINGIPTRMESFERDEESGLFKKMWTPMSNAVLLTVNTWESAHYMGGFDFPGHSRDVCFFDKRVGFIMPGNRFVQTYNLHGGWDLDDSLKVIIVKVHCSDPEILKLHLNKTVPDTYIPAKAEDAKEMVLLVRSPNGPGEWSIEECEIDTLPIPEEMRHDDITVVDIAKMPLPQDILLKYVQLGNMQSGMTFSGVDMTRDDSRTMIEAQLVNPGIGRFCNHMMVWSSISAGFPSTMLAPMEEIVDTVQQEHDVVKFTQIGAEHKEILKHIRAARVPVDAYLVHTRVSVNARKRLLTVAGPMTMLYKEYIKSIETIKNDIRNHTLQMRAAQPLVRYIANHPVNDVILKQAEHFFYNANSEISAADNKYAVNKKWDNAFYKIAMQGAKREALHEVVTNLVAKVDEMEHPDRFILTLWHFILKGNNNKPLGFSDRIIFQPNAAGERNLMDVLIEALLARGLATPVV